MNHNVKLMRADHCPLAPRINQDRIVTLPGGVSLAFERFACCELSGF